MSSSKVVWAFLLVAAALLPTLVEHVWDVNAILDENGPLGSFLKALLAPTAAFHCLR